jgi:acetyl-CoA acetyltransferase family protein
MKSDNTKRLVIVDGVRTPFSRMGTTLAPLGADELGRIAVQALLARTGIDPDLISETIIGCVGQPVDAANVGRVIALRAGIPEHIPAITVHRNCASGAEAVTQAYEKMVAGRGDIYVVGGAESMSQYPFAYSYETVLKFGELMKAKSMGARLKAFSKFRFPDFFNPRVALKLGLTDPVSGLNMGETAELIGREQGVTREEQDAFAAESHLKAFAARERLAEEIAPAYVGPDYKTVMTEDNGPREDSIPEKLAKLRPVFEKGTGTVTAGNSSQITDGAVALLAMSEARANELGYEPLGFLAGYAYAANDPARMGLGPVHAIHAAEQETGFGIGDADLIEINEAFAAQVLACVRGAASETFAQTFLKRETPVGEIPMEKLNVNGGAIALGHPVGATGARLVLTSLKELKRRDAKRAVVTACVGGGQGMALWLERF